MLQTVLLAVVQLGISFIFLYGCSVALFWVSVTFCILYAIAYALFRKPLFVSGLTFKEEQSLYFGKVESVLAHQRFLYVNVLFERALKSIDSFFRLCCTPESPIKVSFRDFRQRIPLLRLRPR